MKFDIIIRRATVVDGTGGPAFHADVGVSDGMIQEIGDLSQCIAETDIDAQGKMLLPGWIDSHTHMDAQCTWDSMLTPISSSGVTTIVVGNCGIGFAPCQPERREFLISLCEAVEDIPGSALSTGIRWAWTTFPEYLDVLERKKFVCDIGAMVGHAPVRTYCLGKKASLSDEHRGNSVVSEEEIDAMAKVVYESIEAGALGFSTSRTILHRDGAGTLTPGTLAEEKELLAIAEAVRKAGGGVFELAQDFSSYDDLPYHKMDQDVLELHRKHEWEWMKKVARHYDLPVSLSLAPPNLPEEHKERSFMYRDILTELESARKEGLEIFGQVFIRPQGILSNFVSKVNPFRFSATYSEILFNMDNGLNYNAFVAALVEKKSTIIQESREILEGPKSSPLTKLAKMLNPFETMFAWQPSYEPDPTASLLAMAKDRAQDPLEVAFDLLVDGKVIWRPMFGYSTRDLSQIQELIESPFTHVGIADGGAHVSILSDCASATHLLTHWTRDRTRGPKLAVEAVVKLQTHDIAKIFGLLHDRGTIEVGKRADLNLVDYEHLQLEQPRYVYDLPEGAPRWVDETKGYYLTMVNGTITYQDGKHTGEFPGRLVRNARSAKEKAHRDQADVPHYRDIAGKEDLSVFRSKRYSETSGVEVATSFPSAGASAIATVIRAEEKQESQKSKL